MFDDFVLFLFFLLCSHIQLNPIIQVSDDNHLVFRFSVYLELEVIYSGKGEIEEVYGVIFLLF
jgi:hypothetical protein